MIPESVLTVQTILCFVAIFLSENNVGQSPKWQDLIAIMTLGIDLT